MRVCAESYCILLCHVPLASLGVPLFLKINGGGVNLREMGGWEGLGGVGVERGVAVVGYNCV